MYSIPGGFPYYTELLFISLRGSVRHVSSSFSGTQQGLGSLWICNSFFAQKELSDWAGGELYAVLAVGYADEAPEARLRKRTEDVIEWRV